VVVCSKAGAEFDLQLIWTLWLASIVAFQLQSQAARDDDLQSMPPCLLFNLAAAF
jgi:hypothetical protein